jgi:trk system potassium uptake protein
LDKTFAVIGLGRFGQSVARTLVDMGYHVLGIDTDEHTVETMASVLGRVVQADATDAVALKALKIYEYDIVVVAIGDDVEASLLTTLNCKELGVRVVVAKAMSDQHGKALQRIGADKVVYPQRDMGARVAYNLVAGGILDYVRLSQEYSMAELVASPLLVGHSLRELDLRVRYGLNVMAIRRGRKVIVSPRPDDAIKEGDVLVVIGLSDGISKVQGD